MLYRVASESRSHVEDCVSKVRASLLLDGQNPNPLSEGTNPLVFLYSTVLMGVLDRHFWRLY